MLRPLAVTMLLLAACPSLAESRSAEERQSAGYPCYGQTRDWKAWVEEGPEPGRPELVVTGIVTTPTGHNRRSLTLGPATRSDPPHQTVELQIKGNGDIVTTVVVTEEVRERFPALPRYGAVIITCNGNVVGRVQPVEHKR